MGRNRDDEGGAARVKLDKQAFKELLKVAPQFKKYERDWQYRNDDAQVFLPVRMFDTAALEAVLKVLRDRGDRADRWLIGQFDAHLAISRDPDSVKITSLRPLERALLEWVKKDAVRGWVFKRQRDGTMGARIVTDVRFHEATSGNGWYHPAYVDMQLSYWAKGAQHSERVEWNLSDLLGRTQKKKGRTTKKDDEKLDEEGKVEGGKTVTELLTDEGVFHENRMMLTLYDKHEQRFLQWRTMLGEQFVGNGTFSGLNEDRHERASEHDKLMQDVRLVVDDDAEPIENRTATMLFRDEPPPERAGEDKGEDESEVDPFTQLPCEFYIDCFNLKSYRGGWVHIDHMQPYEYKPELREKLILPPEQRRPDRCADC